MTFIPSPRLAPPKPQASPDLPRLLQRRRLLKQIALRPEMQEHHGAVKNVLEHLEGLVSAATKNATPKTKEK